jgi:hypothetical protein
MGTAQDKWHKNNKEKLKEYRHKRDTTEEAKLYRNEYMKKARSEGKYKYDRKTYMNEYTKQDRKNKPHLYRWRDLFNRTITKLKQSKDNTTETLMGYSSTTLMEYLSSLDENWVEYQIDHKIPITWFKPTAPISVVNDLRNIHLLTEDENKDKGNKYAHPVCEEYYNIALEYVLDKYRSSLK